MFATPLWLRYSCGTAHIQGLHAIRVATLVAAKVGHFSCGLNTALGLSEHSEEQNTSSIS